MKILLVDDQKKILKATQMLIDWDRLGIDEVFTAESATSARLVLEKEKIDLMLTDIEMPGESGIELHKWQVIHNPEVTTIFLTSHADFAYAKEAIHNGAFDYILQPAKMTDIQATLERAVVHVRNQRELKVKSGLYEEGVEEQLKAMVFSMFSQRGQFRRMQDFTKLAGMEDESWGFIPWIWRIWNGDISKVLRKYQEQRLKDPIGFGTWYCRLNDDLLVGLNGFSGIEMNAGLLKERAHFLVDFISAELGCQMNIYIGEYCSDNLQQEIEALMDFAENRLLERNQVYLIEEDNGNVLREPDSGVWSRWMILGDLELLRNQINNMLKYAKQENALTIAYMRKVITAFLEACSIACYEKKLDKEALFDEAFTYEEMIHCCESIERLSRGVENCLQNYRKLISENTAEEIGSLSVAERIREVCRYLDENIDQVITRHEAAKHVFLNEDYFTRVFKKETGMGYKEYVTRQKVDYAKRYLADTTLPVALIASKVGYDNYANFTQLFKKATDMTPTEYRKAAQTK